MTAIFIGVVFGVIIAVTCFIRGHWVCALATMFIPVFGLPFGIWGCFAQSKDPLLGYVAPVFPNSGLAPDEMSVLDEYRKNRRPEGLTDDEWEYLQRARQNNAMGAK